MEKLLPLQHEERKHMIKPIHLFHFLISISLMFFLACTKQVSKWPNELVEIDSALTKGDYRKGEILLKEYEDQLQEAENEESFMYHKLMRAFLSYRIGDDKNAINGMDSLCRYFKASTGRNEYILSRLIMANTQRINENYPEALKYCLQAENAAETAGKENYLCWIYRQKGLIYKSQKLFDEAQECLKKHFALAEKQKDSRQIIMGLHEMGFVYTYQGNADSAISCYKRSIELAKNRNDSNLFIPGTQSCLYDIYIQLGEYDSVRNVMPRDSINYENWGYYYEDTGNADSAVYYFQKKLNNKNFLTVQRCLKELIKIEKKRNNQKRLIELYELLEQTNDSIRQTDKTTETKRTQARYDYEQIKQQRDELEKREERHATALIILVLAIISLGMTGIYYLRSKKNEKRVEKVQQKLIRKEEETKHTFTEEQQLLLNNFMDSPLYKKIRLNAGNKNFKLTDDEWVELATAIDRVYDNLTERILNLTELTPTELRVVYLLKLNVKPADMATMLCKSKSSITMTRSRMYEKIFGRHGSANDLDTYILSF